MRRKEEKVEEAEEEEEEKRDKMSDGKVKKMGRRGEGKSREKYSAEKRKGVIQRGREISLVFLSSHKLFFP